MSNIKKTFGRPLLKKLVVEAQSLGVSVDFHIDMNGHYIVRTARAASPAPTAAAACYFVRGMIDLARHQTESTPATLTNNN